MPGGAVEAREGKTSNQQRAASIKLAKSLNIPIPPGDDALEKLIRIYDLESLRDVTDNGVSPTHSKKRSMTQSWCLVAATLSVVALGLCHSFQTLPNVPAKVSQNASGDAGEGVLNCTVDEACAQSPAIESWWMLALTAVVMIGLIGALVFLYFRNFSWTICKRTLREPTVWFVLVSLAGIDTLEVIRSQFATTPLWITVYSIGVISFVMQDSVRKRSRYAMLILGAVLVGLEVVMILEETFRCGRCVPTRFAISTSTACHMSTTLHGNLLLGYFRGTLLMATDRNSKLLYFVEMPEMRGYYIDGCRNAPSPSRVATSSTHLSQPPGAAEATLHGGIDGSQAKNGSPIRSDSTKSPAISGSGKHRLAHFSTFPSNSRAAMCSLRRFVSSASSNVSGPAREALLALARDGGNDIPGSPGKDMSGELRLAIEDHRSEDDEIGVNEDYMLATNTRNRKVEEKHQCESEIIRKWLLRSLTLHGVPIPSRVHDRTLKELICLYGLDSHASNELHIASLQQKALKDPSRGQIVASILIEVVAIIELGLYVVFYRNLRFLKGVTTNGENCEKIVVRAGTVSFPSEFLWVHGVFCSFWLFSVACFCRLLWGNISIKIIRRLGREPMVYVLVFGITGLCVQSLIVNSVPFDWIYQFAFASAILALLATDCMIKRPRGFVLFLAVLVLVLTVTELANAVECSFDPYVLDPSRVFGIQVTRCEALRSLLCSIAICLARAVGTLVLDFKAGERLVFAVKPPSRRFGEDVGSHSSFKRRYMNQRFHSEATLIGRRVERRTRALSLEGSFDSTGTRAC